MPVAAAAILAESVMVGSPAEDQAHTQGGEVHQTWKGDDQVVHGVNNTAAIELEGSLYQVSGTGCKAKLTRTPSASELFKTNIMFGRM